MKELIFCFTVDDVAYEGYSSEKDLEGCIGFCDQQGMKATMLAIPLCEDKDFAQRDGYCRILKDAISRGHEVGQHGLRHDRFETGIPPDFILALPHEEPTRLELRSRRELIERENSVENIRGRLALGRRILEDALGSPIRGFRAGAGSSCENLYTALEEEGYTWDSTQIIQEAGWDLMLGMQSISPKPITRERFERLQPSGALRELPLTTDYTWYLTRKNYEASLDLAKTDMIACLEAGIPFVALSHVSPIAECEDGCGFDLYRELLAFAEKIAAERQAHLAFMTLSEACRTFFDHEDRSRNGGDICP